MDYTVHGILQASILEWVAFLFSRVSSTQESNPGLPHCRQTLYQLSHKGSPRILEWVAYPFSSGSSQPRSWTRSPALQADSLPTELWGKPPGWLLFVSKWLCWIHQGRHLNLKGFCVYVCDKAFNYRFNSLINTKLFKLFYFLIGFRVVLSFKKTLFNLCCQIYWHKVDNNLLLSFWYL